MTAARLRVLIVDPWAEDWDDLMPLLTDVGIMISLVATGEDAVRAAHTQRPHVALIEVTLLPGGGRLTSVQTVSKLRELYPNLHIALVSTVVTGTIHINYEPFLILPKREPDDLVDGIERAYAQDGKTTADP